MKGAGAAPLPPPTRTATDRGGGPDLPWRAIVEHSPDVIHLVDAEGLILYTSPSVGRVLGFAPEELIGRRAIDLVHPDDVAPGLAIMGETLRGGPAGTIELRLRHRDGSWRTVAASGALVTQSDSPVLVVSSHDITARKRLEADAEKFRVLVEQSLVGIYIVREERVIYGNARLAETFGYSPEEILDLASVYDLVAEQDREYVRKNLTARVEGAADSGRYQFRGLRSDGATITVEVHGIRSEIDGRSAVIGTLLDITDRVQAEEALRTSEERYRTFFEDDLTGDVISNAAGSILDCNDAFLEMMGFSSREEAFAADIVSLFRHVEEREKMLERLRRGEKVHAQEVELKRRDGSMFHVVLNAAGSMDESGELGEIRRYLFDITARKRAEEALRESEERFRLVARATNEVIWDLDLETGRVGLNDAASRIHRYRPEELAEASLEWWYHRIHPADRDRVAESFQQAVGGPGDRWAAEYRFRRGDGTYAMMLDRGHIVRNERSEPVRVVGSMLDVTERRRSEVVQRFLTHATELLAGSAGLEKVLRAVVSTAVPDMGDFCRIDLVDEAGRELRRVAAGHVDPVLGERLSRGDRLPIDDVGMHPRLRAIRTGRSILVSAASDGDLDELAHDSEHRRALEASGVRSYMIVPMMSRDGPLGTITFKAGESGRRFGPLDLVHAETLARLVTLAAGYRCQAG